MAVTAPNPVMAAGDRRWAKAASDTLRELAEVVRQRAKDIDDDVDVDAVHDARTAIRRLRTAITVYGHKGGQGKKVEKELRRVARQLGAVRDLDVLLETLAKATTDDGGAIDAGDLEPLRHAWQEERRDGARTLRATIDRKRFDRALDDVRKLAPAPDIESDASDGEVHRIADRAPELIWAAYGKVVAFEIDPMTANPTVVHLARIAAKKLRYTLEVFEDALEPGATLIDAVTALQDAAGEMHDAIVARDRARATIEQAEARDRERLAAEAFAAAQDRRSEAQRPISARCLATVRSRAFRDALGSAVAGMGHVGHAS
jgi:CHAD domain-containing protein